MDTLLLLLSLLNFPLIASFEIMPAHRKMSKALFI